MLIFEKTQPGCVSGSLQITTTGVCSLPSEYLRTTPIGLPEVNELTAVRHYTRLSQRNFSIETHFYPLGSCTMKYNPRIAQTLSELHAFQHYHPLAPVAYGQGILQCLFELQEILVTLTGMTAVSLTPMAGAQGELAGIAMIRAYHLDRGDTARREILVPKAAHGTNPATAIMCGCLVKEIPTLPDGDIDLTALALAVGPHTAGIMLTNPSTLGVFERQIKQVADIVHAAGGLLYYDGANLNAILGRTRPADMGFDVVHMNLHKTFATPHGGGGPGSGPVAVNARLQPYLPIPMVTRKAGHYDWLSAKDCPKTIGRLSTFMGNTAILLRAYIYARLLGKEGCQRVSAFATLNANYLLIQLQQAGYTAAFPKRRATHEFIITAEKEKKAYGITALDIAKRLLDKGIHAPTVYFPAWVPECLLIEPTETENKATLDQFVTAMKEILSEAESDPSVLKNAPYLCAVRRLDEVRAAKMLDVKWAEKNDTPCGD